MMSGNSPSDRVDFPTTAAAALKADDINYYKRREQKSTENTSKESQSQVIKLCS